MARVADFTTGRNPLRAGRSAAEPDPELRPEEVDPAPDLFRHHDLVGPAAGEALLLPLARGVDSHLAPVARQTRREVELVDGSVHELDVAFRVDRGERPPQHLRTVSQLRVAIEDDDRLREHHLARTPDGMHRLARVT